MPSPTPGAGRNYLIQHSAGSGKSITIAWTAHQIISLHDDADMPVFDTAIIVTDRIVLDRHLQSTVAAFEKTKGVVKKIDGKSRDLKEAIKSGARIIITTIQKFGTEHLKELSGQGDRRFAVIIDEAHSSQSGKSAQAMSDAPTREDGGSEDVEDKILEYQRARGPQPNISFLAFTATPRNVTLERFGVTGSDGLSDGEAREQKTQHFSGGRRGPLGSGRLGSFLVFRVAEIVKKMVDSDQVKDCFSLFQWITIFLRSPTRIRRRACYRLICCTKKEPPAMRTQIRNSTPKTRASTVEHRPGIGVKFKPLRALMS